MTFVVKKEGNTYYVRNRYTKATRHECTRQSEAAQVAHKLNRGIELAAARPALAAAAG